MLNDLLADIHRSIDRLAEDLTRDRPELASALRQEASLIPQPQRPTARPPATCTQLGTLLYRALAEGALPHRHFDRLMIRRVQVMKCRQSG